MIRSRWLDRPEWEAKLREIGAEPLQGRTALNRGEWWRRPGYFAFTVPVDERGRCDFWAFRRLYVEQGGRPLHGDEGEH